MRTRGLWSTATNRSVQPSMKWRQRWRASATARASPSMAAYRDSAECVNRDPTRVIFQPSLQQNSSRWGHEQWRWNIQNPIPVLLQSVAIHVVRSRSKISLSFSSLSLSCSPLFFPLSSFLLSASSFSFLFFAAISRFSSFSFCSCIFCLACSSLFYSLSSFLHLFSSSSASFSFLLSSINFIKVSPVTFWHMQGS